MNFCDEEDLRLNSNRKQYVEWLRVISAFAVVVIHVTATYIDRFPPVSTAGNMLLLFNSLCRWSVPVFVMISGAVTLNKDYPVKAVLGKAARMCALFLVWSVIYAGIDFANGVRLKTVFTTAVLGTVHLWYLPLAAGLYLMIPVLNRIADSEKTVNYVLGLGIIADFILPTLAGLLKLVNPFLGETLQNLVNMYRGPIFTGYLVYYLLGWKLSNCEISENLAKKIYALGAVCFAASVLGNAAASRLAGAWSLWFSDVMTVFVLGQSAAVYVFAKKKLLNAQNKAVSVISKSSLGIYLIHYAFTIWMGKLIEPGQWNVLVFTAFLVGASALTYGAAFLTTLVMTKIPGLKKIV